MERKTLGFLFLLFLVLAADVAVKGAEGKICRSKSRKYTGACYSNVICANYCKGDAFDDGDCGGLSHVCFCTKNC
ncbi:hypothetical protein VNO80_11608 [Phaseolus coccineus]|uniref:Knottins-like domain-containing protein n=1 Tax=Phaseolus coccineus TaxID=3886 RepID=A0AAN9NAR1_PHACN